MRRIRWRYALPIIVLLGAALLAYFLLFGDLPDPGRTASRGGATAPSILITDRRGRLLYEVIDPAGNKQVPVALAEIPLACRQATIATEDSRFYQHPGVDLLGIARALWSNWRTGETVSGASTLTQQLARTLYLSENERTERSLRRKLREAWLAWRLEQVYSKDELLALYLNTTYYGHFAVGIEAAAQAYFGVHAGELDLAQCALLAGLPQYPAGYNPIENPDAAQGRQAVVLGLMARHGYITPAQAADAGKERLAFAGTPFPIEAPHFVMWVQNQLEALLGRERLAAGGLRVTTTLDLDWQHQAEAIVRRRLAQLQPCASGASAATCDPAADPARRVENAALVALDPATGAVLALVGNPDYFDPTISGAVNAALALRQPGSAIKPLTYAAALDPERSRKAGAAPFTAATIIPDLRASFLTAEGQPYVPQNYDRKYHGPVTVRTALANSYNIAAVRTLDAIGVDALLEQAERLGIPWRSEGGTWNVGAGMLNVGSGMSNVESEMSNVGSGMSNVESEMSNVGSGMSNVGSEGADTDRLPASGFQGQRARYGLALTLGGGEVRLLDLAAAYAAFANGGTRVDAFAIGRVETLDGDVLVDAARRSTLNIQRANALDPRVAYLITDILSDETARLPAFGPGNWLEIDRPAAAKTGTTTDWRDNWTLGYTPDLVTGVWVGNADNTPMKDVSGISGAGPIWHDFMATILRDLPPRRFSPPPGLVQVEVCADSGLLPGPVDGEWANGLSAVPCPQRRVEWFIAGTEPTEVDRSHVQIALDVRTGQPAGADTPAAFVRTESYWLLPAEYQAWARENGVPQPVARSALNVSASNAQPVTLNPQLTSPDPNRVYQIDPGLPVTAQQVPVTARPGSEGGTITLMVDGAPFAALTGPDYTAWWTLSKGRHTFQAVASRADGTRAESERVMVFVE